MKKDCFRICSLEHFETEMSAEDWTPTCVRVHTGKVNICSCQMICALNKTTAFAVQDIWQEVRATCENYFKRNSPGPKPLCVAYPALCMCICEEK